MAIMKMGEVNIIACTLPLIMYTNGLVTWPMAHNESERSKYNNVNDSEE